jgi:hypothetical protein
VAISRSNSWVNALVVQVEFDQNLLSRKGEAAFTTAKKVRLNPAKHARDPSE